MRRIVLAAVLMCLPLQAGADVHVVATLPDLADLAREVGGEHVSVKSIARGYQDPHYVAAKPSFMRDLNRADLLVYNGLELEVGWLPLVLRGARNPRVAVGASGHLNASADVTPLEVPRGGVDRSMGDVHPDGNPHYLLDPRNGRIVAESIAGRLAELDPDREEEYAANLKRFTERLDHRIEQWENQAAGIRGLKIVAYHNLWPYLREWLGIDIIDHVEDKPGIPPSPRHTSDLIARMKAEGIGIVICASYGDVKAASRVAEQAEARLVEVPAAVGGMQGVDTYLDLFDTIVSRLVEAARQ